MTEAKKSKANAAGVASKPHSAGFPIVGIGASAGGLAPDHKSILTDLIQRCTRMQVFEVEDGMTGPAQLRLHHSSHLRHGVPAWLPALAH